MNRLNIVYHQSNKQGHGLPCSYLVIKLQKTDLSTKGGANKMIDTCQTHGCKTKHLNWHYSFLQRAEYCITKETQTPYFEESSAGSQNGAVEWWV